VLLSTQGPCKFAPGSLPTSVCSSRLHCTLRLSAVEFCSRSALGATWICDAQAPEGAPTFKYTRSGFLRAMSDAGLKPTVVYHNLTPAELYEKARSPPNG